MEFIPVDRELPDNMHETVLVRGWGENRAHYVYALARYEAVTASKRWIDAHTWLTLFFEPVDWAKLPQP